MVEFFQGPKLKRYKGDKHWNVHDDRVKMIVQRLFRDGRDEVVIEPLGPGHVMGLGFNHVTGYGPLRYARNLGEGSGRRRLHPKQLQ